MEKTAIEKVKQSIKLIANWLRAIFRKIKKWKLSNQFFLKKNHNNHESYSINYKAISTSKHTHTHMYVVDNVHVALL